jgi:hypothetical protein
MKENEISKVIGDAVIEVHRELGGLGLVEDIYEEVPPRSKGFLSNWLFPFSRSVLSYG